MDTFTLLFKQAYSTLLKKWIPGLRYIYVRNDKIIPFEKKLRSESNKYYYNTRGTTQYQNSKQSYLKNVYQ